MTLSLGIEPGVSALTTAPSNPSVTNFLNLANSGGRQIINTELTKSYYDTLWSKTGIALFMGHENSLSTQEQNSQWILQAPHCQ